MVDRKVVTAKLRELSERMDRVRLHTPSDVSDLEEDRDALDLVSFQEFSYFQAAARRAGLPLSEWARRQLRTPAEETLGRATFGPREALSLIKSLDALVASVEVMLEESVSGRYARS